MVVENVLHMNSGNGDTSYANNSSLQKKVILKVRPVLEDNLEKVYTQFPGECLKIADLGCSSGPNTLLVIREIIETIEGLSYQSQPCKPPELQIYLNDLPENDFNSIFKSLPIFFKNLKENNDDRGERKLMGLGKYFISGVPGSFYCRLFPTNNVHFVHSSYSLHWLSQVPEKLENKGNIYITKRSPPTVYEAYLKQFEKDLSTFLRYRSEEMVSGGRMILTFVCRSSEDPTSNDICTMWDLLAKSLLDLVSEGLIQEEDVDSFNMPCYAPYEDEVKVIIQNEGSFNLETLEVFERNWDPEDEEDEHKSGKNIRNIVRAATEPMLARHFEGLFDLYEKYAKHLTDHLCHDKMMLNIITLSLSKK